MPTFPEQTGNVNHPPWTELRGKSLGNGYIGGIPDVADFALHPGLAVPGGLALADAVPLVLAQYWQWEADGTLSPRTAFAYRTMAEEFRMSCVEDDVALLSDGTTETVYGYVESRNASGSRRPGTAPGPADGPASGRCSRLPATSASPT